MVTKKDHGMVMSKNEIEFFARLLLLEIQKYFESESGIQEFEEWKVKQAKAGKENG